MKFILNGQTYPTDGGWAVGDNWEFGFKGNNDGVTESLVLVNPLNRTTTNAKTYWSPKFKAQKV